MVKFSLIENHVSQDILDFMGLAALQKVLGENEALVSSVRQVVATNLQRITVFIFDRKVK